MKKTKVNFVINAIMFLCMSAIVGIGFLIKYNLVSGQARWVIYGRPVELYWFGLDRHQWGYIHLLLGFVLSVLLVVHLVLHWTLIKSVYKKIIALKAIRKTFVMAFASISILLIFSPFVIQAEVFEKSNHDTYKNHKPQSSDIEDAQVGKDLFLDKTEVLEETMQQHYHDEQGIIIKGYMSLKMISDKYNVPCKLLKEKLGISDANIDQQKLGRLKKKYDFKVSEIKEIITNFKAKKN